MYGDFVIDSPEAEVPGECFAWIGLYIATADKDKVLRHFVSFEHQLRSIAVVLEAID